jgi:minor extracellular serine protease Vpr
MTRRTLAALITAVVVMAVASIAVAGTTKSAPAVTGPAADRPHSALPDDFEPAVLRAQDSLNRYFVVVDGPSVASRMRTTPGIAGRAQAQTASLARRSQRPAIEFARSSGGDVVFRYDTLLDGFSATLTPAAAARMAARSDVKSVEPVSIVEKLNNTAVPFIGATHVWKQLGEQGQGETVAMVDTGIDYTHANFGGPGTVAAYDANDPNIIEPGTFPTRKVIGGYDFVGSNYDVLDADPDNDIPRPDPDPLDGVDDDHGSHTSGTCCGIGVKGEIGPGVAPRAKLLAIKVWDEGDSTDDVLVAGYERAMDPNNDGNTKDAADVLSFSGGIDYGTMNSVEARAAQQVVDMGTVFVAAAGNAGNQPVGGSAYIAGTPANAPGVISVAASIDRFEAQTLTVNQPKIELPDGGIIVEQDFGGQLPDGGLTADLYDGRQLDPPASPGDEGPADAQFCDPLPAGSLAGKTVLVFKGSTDSGDCAGSLKVFNAQNAGATAVILISLFGGAPSALSSDGQAITIPAVMVSGNDGYAILDELSPGKPPVYNSGAVNATLETKKTVIPDYSDAMTDFTSEGPARLTSALKPDISAPGFDIKSTDAGTGDKGLKLSGTSMATPMVAGVATLLRGIHPGWSPGRIKAAIMNQANQKLKDNLLGSPVSATVMGSGRVDAFASAKAVSVAEPGSISYGLDIAAKPLQEDQKITVQNLDSTSHHYVVSGGKPRYTDFGGKVAKIELSLNGADFSNRKAFSLPAHTKQRVYVRLDLNPDKIAPAEHGLYYFNANIDGNVEIAQSRHGSDSFHVPWHVVPLAAARDRLTSDHLDLNSGPATLEMKAPKAAAKSYADLYQLGATDGLESFGEEDILAVGARSFTGTNLSDGTAVGVPSKTDGLGGVGWLDFLADPDPPAEPVEFGIQTAGVHNTTESLEVDVFIDAGADGVYAGAADGIPADYLLVKQAAQGGEVCVIDLSVSDTDCAETYFPDYSNYNSANVGMVASAGDIGLTNAHPTLAYSVSACTGAFSGDVPALYCDTAGDAGADGIYGPKLDATHPALVMDKLVCKGFWGGSSCSGDDAVQVTKGTGVGANSDPSILALFPQNAPSHDPTVVTTDTTP